MFDETIAKYHITTVEGSFVFLNIAMKIAVNIRRTDICIVYILPLIYSFLDIPLEILSSKWPFLISTKVLTANKGYTMVESTEIRNNVFICFGEYAALLAINNARSKTNIGRITKR